MKYDIVTMINEVVARWETIQKTYRQAYNAESYCPGVPLRDVFVVNAVLDGQYLECKYAKRGEHIKYVKELSEKYPGCTIELSPGCQPYNPRKGEPKYKEWKSLFLGSML